MTISDEHIITAIERNPELGFRLLMRQYKEPVYWHIRRLVVSHADAQDASQNAFLRIFRSFNQFNKSHSFRAWIYKIATNEALRIINSHTDMMSLEQDGVALMQMKSDEYIDYGQALSVLLQQAILSLPYKQQLAFNMRYFDDMTYEQIAEAVNSNVAAVKMNYHLAKEKIIKYMKSE
ncbi:MAG: sigma-70 family RNA polymerase sigma factor [Prevotella sp.]|nr:sigma-70 family RNA polymerase sigma factor [Prevotella sp.]